MTTSPNPEHEQKLVNLFAQLAGAMMERGLTLARADDPHTYATARRCLEAEGSKFELRTVLDPKGADFTVTGLVVDAGGEALAEVFTVKAARSAPQ